MLRCRWNTLLCNDCTLLCGTLGLDCSDEIDATRMGFRESNEAHQRTAERCNALEQELHTTRKTADSSRAEAAGLRGQVIPMLE